MTDQIGVALSRCKSEGVPSGEIKRTTKEVLSRIKYVAKTGIQPFDDLVGGFPFGRVCELYGLESCGKTAMAVRTCVRAKTFNIVQLERNVDGTEVATLVDRKKCVVEVLYMDNEQSLDDDAKLTVDGTRLDANAGRCDSVDQLFKLIDQAISTIEAYQEANPDMLVFLVVVIDTIASTASKEELLKDYGKADFPRQAKELRQSFRKLMRDINRNNVCLLCTNQVSDNFNKKTPAGRPKGATPSSEDYVTFGGRALLFFSTHRIFLYALPTKYRLLPSAKFAAGFLIGFFAKKNRIRQPSKEGRMVLLFDQKMGGLNNVFSILETLLFLGFAELQTKEKGKDIKFKFARHGVPLTTFGDQETTLEEDDKVKQRVPRRKKDPEIVYRAEWPKFYHEHKADMDALYEAAMVYARSTPGIEGVAADGELDSLDEDMEENG